MAFLLPKIVYNATTLNFTYPPVSKPGVDDLEQQRTDSISLSGLKQSISVRSDDFFNLQMDFVPQADLPAWQLFMQWALAGNQFQYYPDASIGVFITFTLEDTKWLPTRAFFGTAKFKLRFRKVPVPQFVQSARQASAVVANPTAQCSLNGVKAGHVLLIGVWTDGIPAADTCTDNHGTVYTLAVKSLSLSASSQRYRWYTGTAPADGNYTVTHSPDTTGGGFRASMLIVELTGGRFDTSAENDGAGGASNPCAVAITPTGAAFLVAIATLANGNTGWTDAALTIATPPAWVELPAAQFSDAAPFGQATLYAVVPNVAGAQTFSISTTNATGIGSCMVVSIVQ